MKTLALTTAGLLLCSVAAFAQTPGTTGQPAMNGVPMRQELMQSLQKNGFSDIKVVPDSFFISAKDKAGNPVSMLVSPNSVTELVAQNAGPGTMTGASATPGQTGQTGPITATSLNQDVFASRLNGVTVKSEDGQGEVGTVRDLALRNGRLQAYVVALNDGRTIAVTPAAITVQPQQGSTPMVKLDMTQAQLQAAPKVTYKQQG